MDPTDKFGCKFIGYRFFISPRMNPGACILDAFGHFKAVEPSILIFDGPFPDITEPCARDEGDNRITAAIGRVDINPIAAIPYCANSARCAA